MRVLVEFWGPVERTNGYGWRPLGYIDAESLDADYMRNEVMKMVAKLEYKPVANIARLEVIRDGRKDMKITLTDLW